MLERPPAPARASQPGPTTFRPPVAPPVSLPASSPASSPVSPPDPPAGDFVPRTGDPPVGLDDVERAGRRSIVPRVVDGWHRQGRPVDLVLGDSASAGPVLAEPASREPTPLPGPGSGPAPRALPGAASPPAARRSLGGTPAPWARPSASPGPDDGADLDPDRPGDPEGPGSRSPSGPPASRPTGPGSAPGIASGTVPGTGAPPRAPAVSPGTALARPGASGASGDGVDPGAAPDDGALDGPLVARDPTALGPSLPRRAGSLVRRWVTRVVSFIKRLPVRLGLRTGTEAATGTDAGKG